MTLRKPLIALAWFIASCSKADHRQSTTADSTEQSSLTTVTASSSARNIHPPNAGKDSSGAEGHGISVVQVAKLHGSAVPDRIDTLMTAALNTRGAFTGDNEMYEFSGSKKAFEDLGKVSSAVPRLVDCIGWDQRAASTYQGARVLAGVVCDEALIRNPTIQKLLMIRGPNGYPDVWVDFRNPPLAEVRKAQERWRQLLQNRPM